MYIVSQQTKSWIKIPNTTVFKIIRYMSPRLSNGCGSNIVSWVCIKIASRVWCTSCQAFSSSTTSLQSTSIPIALGPFNQKEHFVKQNMDQVVEFHRIILKLIQKDETSPITFIPILYYFTKCGILYGERHDLVQQISLLTVHKCVEQNQTSAIQS